MADRSQCNGKPQAAVGDRFIVPAYTYSPRILWADVALLTIRSQRNGKPQAAVGADLSRPHIRIHPRNGKRKCVFDEMNVYIQ